MFLNFINQQKNTIYICEKIVLYLKNLLTLLFLKVMKYLRK